MIPKALEGVTLTCGAKPLRDKGHTYAPGEYIPDAAEWPNIAMHLRRSTVIASPPVNWRMVRPSLPKPGVDPVVPDPKEYVSEAKKARADKNKDEALEALILLDENTNIRRIKRLMSEAGLEPADGASKKELLKQIDEALK